MNSTSIPLLIGDSSSNSKIEHLIAPNSEKIYNFETKEDKNFIKIRPDIEYEAGSKIPWSTNFSLDNVDDFLISMKVSPEESKLELEDENLNKWYLPSKRNQYTRYVRVIITTRDNATLFVILSDPSHPDVMINNMSDEQIEFKQKDGK